MLGPGFLAGVGPGLRLQAVLGWALGFVFVWVWVCPVGFWCFCFSGNEAGWFTSRINCVFLLVILY